MSERASELTTSCEVWAPVDGWSAMGRRNRVGHGLYDDEGLFTNLRGSRLELWDWVGDGDVWVR